MKKYVTTRLTLREMALIQLILNHAYKVNLFERNFSHTDKDTAKSVAQKLGQRIAKNKDRLLKRLPGGNCTGCGGSPYLKVPSVSPGLTTEVTTGDIA